MIHFQINKNKLSLNNCNITDLYESTAIKFNKVHNIGMLYGIDGNLVNLGQDTAECYLNTLHNGLF
jgi:hypothetical protein